MAQYRRWYVPGGTYFFTLVTYQRRPLFKDFQARRLLGSVIREVRGELPFETVAMVLMHDHMHAVWMLPRGDDNYSRRWNASDNSVRTFRQCSSLGRWKEIKGRFSEKWLASGGAEAPVTVSQSRRGHRGIWQRRFWEHAIRDEHDLEAHVDYIHYNPVKHGYAKRPLDWPYSTFHKFVRLGHYPQDWGRSEPASITSLDLE